VDKEEIKAIIEEVLLEKELISNFEKDINGIDTEFPKFKEKVEKRLQKLEDIIDAKKYKYKKDITLYECTDNKIGPVRVVESQYLEE